VQVCLSGEKTSKLFSGDAQMSLQANVILVRRRVDGWKLAREEEEEEEGREG
jgi:hypothetical protein